MSVNRGSEWRKWDLHFHTPSSYDYGDKTVTNDMIIETLYQNKIAVVAITDHHLIDINRIKELQRLGTTKSIVVLPGIEFLSDARGKDPIHFIAIFSENSNIEHIWRQIENKTNIQDIRGKGKKPDEVYCNLLETINLIKELGGITTIHAGEKTNTIENITHSLPHGDAQKTDIARAIDFYELGKPEDKNGYLSKVFPSIKKHLPMIICSDNHNIHKYSLKENCWIKADPTFEGLKQVIYEPKQRVRIQFNKPQEKVGYQAIDFITIKHPSFKEQTLYLNQNLNCIIGGRSTGKSLLLGAIAKKLKSDKDVKGDNAIYAEFINDIVGKITIKWKDGEENDNRDIEYFPQSYMHTLARDNGRLNELVEGIIKQDQTKRNALGHYRTFTNETANEITNQVNKLFLLKFESTTQKERLKEKGDEQGITAEVRKLSIELEELRSKSTISIESTNKYPELRDAIYSKEKQNEQLALEHSLVEGAKTKFFTNKNIDVELVSVSDKSKEEIKSLFTKLSEKFQTEWEAGLTKVMERITNQIQANAKEIQSTQANEDYIKGHEIFQSNNQFLEIEGKHKAQLDKLRDIEKIKNDILELEKQSDSLKTSIKQLHKSFHDRLTEITDSLTIMSGKLTIKADIKIDTFNLKELLNRSINLQSYERQGLVNTEVSSPADYFQFLDTIFNLLLEEKIVLKGQNTHQQLCQNLMSSNYFYVNYQIVYDDNFHEMSEGKKAFVVLLLLLDFSNKDCPILIDQPEDDLDNRAIYTDLVKYLIEKKKHRQIILVTHNPNIVVGADSELVIVANQNGVDSPNEHNFKFEYISGSLENSKTSDQGISFTLQKQGIREHVCEILEGGNEAFKQRERKYSLVEA